MLYQEFGSRQHMNWLKFVINPGMLWTSLHSFACIYMYTTSNNFLEIPLLSSYILPTCWLQFPQSRHLRLKTTRGRKEMSMGHNLWKCHQPCSWSRFSKCIVVVGALLRACRPWCFGNMEFLFATSLDTSRTHIQTVVDKLLLLVFFCIEIVLTSSVLKMVQDMQDVVYPFFFC